MRIQADRCFLLIVDVQERLAPKVEGCERVISNCAVLMKAAALLALPVLASEHYSQGLGPLVPELKALAGEHNVLQKNHFSCQDEPECAARFTKLGRPQIVIAGMEAHVCVMQTALGLKAAGYAPFVVADATGSRCPESQHAAIERLRAAGVPIATTEMVVFEWLECGDRPEFKDVLALIK